MSVRRALVATALAPLVGLALVGCQEAEPSPKMPATSAASPTPAETATAEQESPEEFIRRWTESSFQAQNTGDTSLYRSMSPRCIPCTSFADKVDEVYGSGGSIKVHRLAVIGVTETEVADRYKVTRLSGRTVIADGAGETTQEFPGGREALIVSLKGIADGWSVTNFVRTTL